MANVQSFVTKIHGPTTTRRDRGLFEWSSADYEATEGDEYKPRLSIKHGYPIEYSCENVLEEGVEHKNFPFRFDYDLTFAVASSLVLEEVRRHFEWALLWNVGVEIGLYNCSFDAQGPQLTGNLQKLSDQDEFQVVALGSAPEDLPDDGIMCLSQNPACVAMKGVMNAKYTGNESAAKKYLLKKIEQVLELEVVLVKGVTAVLSVDDRATANYEGATFEPPDLSIDDASTTTTTTRNYSGLQWFGLVIGAATAVALLVSLVIGLYSLRTVRKRRVCDKDSDGTQVSITSIEIDLSSASTPEGAHVKTETFKSEDEAVADTNDSTQLTSIADTSTEVVTKSAVVPPKRKTRWKKKKKRKKNMMTLQRSSSLKSMDTITEEHEEERDSDDYESDCGSEYSTDDEETDVHMKRSVSTGSLSSYSSQPMVLEEIKESPRMPRLPPPPV